MKTRNILFAAFAACCLIACSESDVESPKDPYPQETPQEPADTFPDGNIIPLKAKQKALINPLNRFAYRSLQAVEAQNRKNPAEPEAVIYSPLSAAYLLGMLAEGAYGQTLTEILDVLGFGGTTTNEANEFFHAMLNNAPLLDSLVKVNIANAIYVNKGYSLYETYRQKLKTFYKADSETLDFASPEAADRINEFAKKQTFGMISKVLEETNPSYVSYLLNAIYFEGSWTMPFDPKAAVQQNFLLPSGEQKQVPMMYQEAVFEYGLGKKYDALRLPYGNKTYEMIVVLPHRDGSLDETLQLLAEQAEIQVEWKSRNTIVMLPRFTIESNLPLIKVLSSLGMPSVFDENICGLTKICKDIPLYVDMMKQVARIEVTDQGTKAAAVTIGGVKVDSMPPTFIANRPFVYIITERSTGAIFFAGTYCGE